MAKPVPPRSVDLGGESTWSTTTSTAREGLRQDRPRRTRLPLRDSAARVCRQQDQSVRRRRAMLRRAHPAAGNVRRQKIRFSEGSNRGSSCHLPRESAIWAGTAAASCCLIDSRPAPASGSIGHRWRGWRRARRAGGRSSPTDHDALGLGSNMSTVQRHRPTSRSLHHRIAAHGHSPGHRWILVQLGIRSHQERIRDLLKLRETVREELEAQGWTWFPSVEELEGIDQLRSGSWPEAGTVTEMIRRAARAE
jgi:hypothetical protein